MKRSKRGDICWTFVENDPHSPWQRTYRFDFSYIRSDRLRREFQDYLWRQYRSGDKTLATLRQENSWFKYYETWLYERGIDTLFQIQQEDAEGFLTYLHTCVSRKTNRPLRLITQKHIYDTIRGIYHWYAMCRPGYVTVEQMFPKDVYQRINRTVRTECVFKCEVEEFLQELEKTENPCLRYGGTILSETGLSPSDLLGLQIDCIQMRQGCAWMCYYHHRTRTDRTVPVSERCVRSVQMLKERTEALRRNAPERIGKQLFLHSNRRKQVVAPAPDLFRYWMRRAQRAESARNTQDVSESGVASNGETITATMVRRALLWDMWERKVPYMVIRELSGYPLCAERGNLI